MTEDNPTLGVIVGRFQVPYLHEGHLELFRAVLARHRRVAVFVGINACGNLTRRNPLDFETRRRMIQSIFPVVTVLPLPDTRTDEEWSANLDREINNLLPWGTVQLYGSRDSFVPHYKGKHFPKELVLHVLDHNGTSIRAGLTDAVLDSQDFRIGVIHAVNNRRKGLYPTVDVAILNRGEDGVVRVLLGIRRSLPNLWRFIGGYADQECFCYEDDARREVYEETNLDLDALTYISSRSINDWRYMGENDSLIRTVFFAGWSMTRGGKAGDDIDGIHWMEMGVLSERSFVDEHRVLYFDLVEYLKKENQHDTHEQSQSASSNG